MIAANVVFLQPTDLRPLDDGRSFEERVLQLTARHGVDSSNSAILLETQRAGIGGIVTADGDLLRAQIDFDVFTWL